MRLENGEKAPAIQLPAIDGSSFDSGSLDGKPYLLSFYRFATCPFCNMRIHALIQRQEEFGDNFRAVAIFESPLAHLKRHTEGHHAPFPILADPDKRFYKIYGLGHSLAGMLKGMITRFGTLMKGMFKGHIPMPIKGSLIRMPADFLVDEKGIIQVAHYGKDEGDHIPIEQVVSFFNKR